jgi:PhnB protein
MWYLYPPEAMFKLQHRACQHGSKEIIPMAVKPIPDGYHSLTPFIVAKGADKLIAFLKSAFGATEAFPIMKGPDGSIKHAEMKVGNSIVMLSEAMGSECPAQPCMLYHYVTDVDAVYKQAVAAGGKAIKEPMDQFYGDRSGGVTDPCGNQWWIATHKEDVSPEECEKRMAQQMKEKAHAK